MIRRKPVVSHTSRFAYIEVVSPTRSWSIRIHQSRFAYIEKKKRNSNRIAINLTSTLRYARVVIASCVIFVWHSERVDSAQTKFKFNLSCTISRRILLCCLYAFCGLLLQTFFQVLINFPCHTWSAALMIHQTLDDFNGVVEC